jgi:hypothetical protein
MRDSGRVYYDEIYPRGRIRIKNVRDGQESSLRRLLFILIDLAAERFDI